MQWAVPSKATPAAPISTAATATTPPAAAAPPATLAASEPAGYTNGTAGCGVSGASPQAANEKAANPQANLQAHAQATSRGTAVATAGKGSGNGSGNGSGPLVLVGHGGGGVDEMASYLDDTKMMYGLLQVVIGSGFLARSKYVFVTFAGDACHGRVRMRLAARRGEARELLGGGAMVGYAIERRADAHIGGMLEQLAPHFVADNGGESSLAALRAELERQVKAAQEALRSEAQRKEQRRAAGSGSGGGGGVDSRSQARTLRALRADAQLDEARALCQQPSGPVNWLLVTPDGALLEGGGGSVGEMGTFLPEAGVSFGLVRMAFGSGRFRRGQALPPPNTQCVRLSPHSRARYSPPHRVIEGLAPRLAHTRAWR